MMNITRATAVGLAFVGCSPVLAQDLYRCDLADRRVVYQGAQCAIGVKQKAIDPTNARREQIRKTLEQERQQKQKSEAVTTQG